MTENEVQNSGVKEPQNYKLISDYLATQEIEHFFGEKKEKEAPREVKYLIKTGMSNRHLDRKNSVLQLRAISNKPMRKHVRAAMLGRIGVNKPWGLATTYFLTKHKAI